MNEIIFSINTRDSILLIANKLFYQFFSSACKISQRYLENDLIDLIFQKAVSSLEKNSETKFYIEIENNKYLFYVEKIDEDIMMFNGQLLESNNIKKDDIQNILSLLADNLPDMLWAKDITGHYIFANKAICNNLLMAKDSSEVIGKTDVFFALREREKYKENKSWHTFGELCLNSDEVVLENMKAMRFEEFGNIKGKPMYLEVHKAPFFDDEGKLLGIVGSGRDRTEEVLAKKELKQKDILLTQQSKMAAMGEMIENIAHQWRQPLSLISTVSTVAMIEKEMNLIGDKDIEEKFTLIKNTIDYLSQTIDDFQSFFKPNKEKKLFNLKNSLEKALLLINSKLKNENILISQDIEDIEILGLENELIQVIINLLNNAKDALGDTKNQKDKKKLIFISAKKNDNKVCINIKDNAGGIPSEVINKVFEPYFTTKEESNGTGIGLYISQIIISDHLEGSLNVENINYAYENIEYTGASFEILLTV